MPPNQEHVQLVWPLWSDLRVIPNPWRILVTGQTSGDFCTFLLGRLNSSRLGQTMDPRHKMRTKHALDIKIRKYEWAKEQEEAFQMLKDNLCDAPILSLPDGSKEFVVYCDASNQGFGCVLMQKGKLSVKDKILAALGKVSKVENVTAKMLCGMDQLMERKEGGGMYLLWVPLIGDERTIMMDEAHASRYLVHSGVDKTYYDLRDMYGVHVWRRILLPMLAIV
ncbi:putative reverse transcriptase domain-containing protein [Tanacetum coccineum]